jgi:DNA-binding LytR/AlgR family response regulator
MRIVIIEDEKLAAERLQSIIEAVAPEATIINIIESVERSIEWFNGGLKYDLVFMDIQLADGISFEIFEKTKILAPVIFTTAYDEYAVKAFKVNSIDYILKPFDETDISRAILKFKSMQQPIGNTLLEPALINKMLSTLGNKYKNRFVIKVGEHIRFVATDEITYIFSLEKSTFLQTNSNKSYAIDFALDEVEEMLDPARFFRINRKYIVSIESIADIVSFTNSRLKLKIKQCTDDDVIVSREKVQEFKRWLEG